MGVSALPLTIPQSGRRVALQNTPLQPLHERHLEDEDSVATRVPNAAGRRCRIPNKPLTVCTARTEDGRSPGGPGGTGWWRWRSAAAASEYFRANRLTKLCPMTTRD
jgi:hypothetical protein